MEKAQRRLVTIVFTDIVGSTQLKQHLGEREFGALIKRTMRSRVRACGSRRIETAATLLASIWMTGTGPVARWQRSHQPMCYQIINDRFSAAMQAVFQFLAV